MSSQTPYVLLGMHGGNGQMNSNGPSAIYRTDTDSDFVWLSADGKWGCTSNPDICESSLSLPDGFGYDTWHATRFAEVPLARGWSFTSTELRF